MSHCELCACKNVGCDLDRNNIPLCYKMSESMHRLSHPEHAMLEQGSAMLEQGSGNPVDVLIGGLKDSEGEVLVRLT